ncbi:very short patch repair endonuclease [Janthinobacterium sp. 13]|uniref:very short patch repair endonuclease n=1 Tax=Janthinobacterium sp. 13 TaxID=2035211 RepID=UPI000C16C47B|nr:DNA mismatch endonuclease Vsr [Janthinobacterium sp. 13]PIF13009.1 T/G mismatch-specific endonuclease [Janthinobacterium sp. 13]
MVDTLTPAERSARMALIRSKDTVPELVLRKAIHALGMRYRLHAKDLPGKPDLIFPRYHSALFVHGCFWHRHEGCKVATTPRSNTDFWIEKFNKNTRRDARTIHALESLGWRVIIVWECEVSTAARAGATAKRIAEIIRRDS